jgi:hypothetical protein
MIARLTKHVRGNAVAYVAVFLALGGTSYGNGSPRQQRWHGAAASERGRQRESEEPLPQRD